MALRGQLHFIQLLSEKTAVLSRTAHRPAFCIRISPGCFFLAAGASASPSLDSCRATSKPFASRRSELLGPLPSTDAKDLNHPRRAAVSRTSRRVAAAFPATALAPVLRTKHCRFQSFSSPQQEFNALCPRGAKRGLCRRTPLNGKKDVNLKGHQGGWHEIEFDYLQPSLRDGAPSGCPSLVFLQAFRMTQQHPPGLQAS